MFMMTMEIYTNFEPKKLEVKSGDTVIFTHTDPYNVHNIMFEPNGIPKNANIPMMSPEEMNEGETWKVTFSKSGTYKYHCHPHYDMGMMGEIIVDHPSKPEEMNMDAEMGDHAFIDTLETATKQGDAAGLRKVGHQRLGDGADISFGFTVKRRAIFPEKLFCTREK